MKTKRTMKKKMMKTSREIAAYVVCVLAVFLVVFLVESKSNFAQNQLVSLQQPTLTCNETCDETIDNLETMIATTDQYILTSNSILSEQQRIQYKYAEVPLDPEILNEILIQAEKYDVDPDYIIAIIDIESDFDPNAKNSSSTATGLGQLLESTGRSSYKRIYGDNAKYTHDMAYDPILNVELTVETVGVYFENKGKNYSAMLTSYTGGAGYESAYQQEIRRIVTRLKEREATYIYN